jgi:hypothetical protein
MINPHRIGQAIIISAALLTIPLGAQTACPPTPGKYHDLEFGDTRFAVEENCRHDFTQNEQFFLAGVARVLQSGCKLPRDREGGALIEQFTNAAASSLDLQKHANPPDDSLVLQGSRSAAFAAGSKMMEEIRCNGPEAALLTRGIVLYLKRTAGESRFVAGCAGVYQRRYTDKQCRCMADALGPVVPDVDHRFFDRQLVKESIHRSPRVALTLIFTCDMPDY